MPLCIRSVIVPSTVVSASLNGWVLEASGPASTSACVLVAEVEARAAAAAPLKQVPSIQMIDTAEVDAVEVETVML